MFPDNPTVTDPTLFPLVVIIGELTIILGFLGEIWLFPFALYINFPFESLNSINIISLCDSTIVSACDFNVSIT